MNKKKAYLIPNRLIVFGAFLIVCFAVLLRVWLALNHSQVWYDQVLYCNDAQNVLQGKWEYIHKNKNNFYTLQESGLSAYNHPLYPIFIAGLSLITNNVELSAVILSFLFQLILIVISFVICREIMGKIWALFVLYMLLFSSYLIMLSVSCYAESMYMGFIALSAYSLLRFYQNNSTTLFAFLTGIFLGCAYLTKPEAITLVIVFLLFFAFRKRTNTASFKKNTVIPVAVFLFSLITIISPYCFYLVTAAGQNCVPNKLIYNLIVAERMENMRFDQAFFELDKDARETVLSRRTETETIKSLISGKVIHLTLRSIKNMYSILNRLLPNLLGLQGIFYSLLVFMGVAVAWARPGRGSLIIFFILFLTLQSIPYSIMSFLDRPLYTLFPMLVVLGSYAFSILGNKFCDNKNNIKIIIFFLIICLMGVWGINEIFFKYKRSVEFAKSHAYAEYVGSWIRENSGANAIIMCREPSIPYYAERAHVIFPWGGDEEKIYSYANYKRADIVVDVISKKNLQTSNLRLDKFKILNEFKHPDFNVLVYKVLTFDAE